MTSKSRMKAYMVYSRCCGCGEAAQLVIAKTAREAKAYAWQHGIRDICDEFVDVAVNLIRDPNKEARDLIAKGETVLIFSPETCTDCEMWGNELDENGRCDMCADTAEENI